MPNKSAENGIPALAGQVSPLCISGLFCGLCGASIKSKGKWVKKYCSGRCRAKAADLRKIEREANERKRFIERVFQLVREYEQKH